MTTSGLRAGAACVDATPTLGMAMRNDRRAVGVHDPLHVRAFALERDGSGLALAVCDNLGVKRSHLDRAKARIAEATGLDPSRVMISCTHTHTAAQAEGPYADFLVERIVDAVRLAWWRREPAEAGWKRATEGRVVFNRRYRIRDGTVQTNPRVHNPGKRVTPREDILGPAGPVDPEVSALGLRRPDGRAIGLLATYALHYVGTPHGTEIVSADYYGVFPELLQRLRGERFVAAMANGASGDVNNADVMAGVEPRRESYEHVERVAALLAADALWAWNSMAFAGGAALGAAMVELALRRRPLPTDEEVAMAEELASREAAGEPLLMAEWAFHRRIRRLPQFPDEIATWVQALRVGDCAIVAAPGELFVELGIEIKRRSPFGQTAVVGLANDSIGYIPTRRAFEEGGYEPEISVLAPGKGERIVETAVALLLRLHEE